MGLVEKYKEMFGTAKPNRTRTVWINIVNEPRENTEFSIYKKVDEYWEYEGTVEFIGKGEVKYGDKVVESKVLIIQNGNRRYGFNYAFATFVKQLELLKVSEGDKIVIKYLGLAKQNPAIMEALDIPENTRIFDIEVAEKAA